MSVKFIAKIRESLGNITRYRLALMLNQPIGSIDHLEDKAEGIKLPVLVRLRKISKLTWTQFGKLLDEEFLDK